ncbi:MAG: hypothetical protein ABSG43_04715 [Solirubrobacteraceae bacterium]|jgi:outer membrane lipoprotein-sorting protein
MRFLRTVSTPRLLAMIAGLVAAVAGGTAIAVAAAGAGPVAPAKPLAAAIHDALAAPPVTGISARITFTNGLISANDILGSDPLLNGARGRFWLGDDQLRLELQGDNGDAQVVVDDGSFTIYDPTSNTAYEGKLPAGQKSGATKSDAVPTLAQIQSNLNQLLTHVDLTGAGSGAAAPTPGDIAGQPAYTVRVSPKHAGGLLGAAQLAWDSANGVPLELGVYARDDSSPVLELKATEISFGKVDSSVFNFTPPPGTKIVTVSTPAGATGATSSATARKQRKGAKQHAEVTGVAAVARRLSFGLVAPAKLVGVPRQSVSLLDSSGTPGALVTYGQDLGGMIVVEQPQQAGAGAASATSSGSGSDQQGLSLPSVSIDGASGQELDTALGTVVRFSRGAITFTVLGSVPAVAADDAARALAAQVR